MIEFTDDDVMTMYERKCKKYGDRLTEPLQDILMQEAITECATANYINSGGKYYGIK